MRGERQPVWYVSCMFRSMPIAGPLAALLLAAICLSETGAQEPPSRPARKSWQTWLPDAW